MNETQNISQHVNTARTTLKGNSIYLSQVPKTEIFINEEEFEEMPTFRELLQREINKDEDLPVL